MGVDGPWCDDLHVAIWVIGLKISTVEVDTEPVGLVDAFDNLEHLGRRGGDAAMIFECEEDTAGCGVPERFVDCGGTAFDGGQFGVTFGNLTGKDADGGGTEDCGVVDPLAAFGELFFASFTGSEAEIITNGGCGHGESLPVEEGSQTEQVLGGDSLGEVVACEFGGGKFLFGAEEDELFEVHFGCGDLIGGPPADHLAVEGVACEAEAEEGIAGSFGRGGWAGGF